jgi:hypothetical protein
VTTEVIRQLTRAQLELAGRVCNRARGLRERLRELGQLQWESGTTSADVTAVRGWLFDVHRDDPYEAPQATANAPFGVRGAL